jgi:hypothetical protein
MGEIARAWSVALLSQVIDRPLKVHSVPKNDGGHDQIQPARAVALVLIGTVADFTESIEEHRSAKRILLLTLVEPDVAATTQLGILAAIAA